MIKFSCSVHEEECPYTQFILYNRCQIKVFFSKTLSAQFGWGSEGSKQVIISIRSCQLSKYPSTYLYNVFSTQNICYKHRRYCPDIEYTLLIPTTNINKSLSRKIYSAFMMESSRILKYFTHFWRCEVIHM